MNILVSHCQIRYASVFCIGVIGVVAMTGCGDRAGGVNIWSAVASDDVKGIERYASAGGDLNCTNFSGNTPLMVAFDSKKSASYERLLELGADPNTTTSDGLTLVARATVKKNWETGEEYDTSWLRVALEHGGDPNLLTANRASKSMISPLSFANSTGLLEHVELLIAYGADVNYLDETEQRPLITAIGSGRYEVVLLLLESGADYTADDTQPCSFMEAVHRIRKNRDVQLQVPRLREGFLKVEAWLLENGVVFEE